MLCRDPTEYPKAMTRQSYYESRKSGMPDVLNASRAGHMRDQSAPGLLLDFENTIWILLRRRHSSLNYPGAR
jgi:hypothetical protein